MTQDDLNDEKIWILLSSALFLYAIENNDIFSSILGTKISLIKS